MSAHCLGLRVSGLEVRVFRFKVKDVKGLRLKV